MSDSQSLDQPDETIHLDILIPQLNEKIEEIRTRYRERALASIMSTYGDLAYESTAYSNLDKMNIWDNLKAREELRLVLEPYKSQLSEAYQLILSIISIAFQLENNSDAYNLLQLIELSGVNKED